MNFILKNFFNTLRRYKASSLLNIIGLAVAFASLYIILVQVNFDLNYNSGIKDAERVYRLEVPSWYNTKMYSCWLNRPTPERFISNCPQVEKGGTAFVLGMRQDFYINVNNIAREFALQASEISTPILDIWGFELVSGDFKDFDQPKNVIISESAAKKTGLTVGKQLYNNSDLTPSNAATVVAIFKDFPNNVDGSKIEVFANIGKRCLDDDEEWSFNYYIKLNSLNDTAGFNKQIKEFCRNEIIESGKSPSADDFEDMLNHFLLRIQPIDQTYFAKDVDNAPGMVGNQTTTYTLLAIGVLIIVIALINFVNFFFALVPVRIKSVNTYKIFGSPNLQIRCNFIMEAFGLIVLALILAWSLLLLINNSNITELISAPIAIGQNLPILAITIAAALIVALIGSVYPSYYITSFPTAMVIKGSFAGSKSGQRLRYTLIGLQFTISISLIICASFIKLQHSYMMEYDMGFNKDNLLTTNIPTTITKEISTRDAFSNKLLQLPQIKDVAWASGQIVAPARMGWGREFKNENINFQCYPVSWNFLKFMGISIAEGRDFMAEDEVKENGSFIFNLSAKKDFNLTLEDKVSGHNGPTNIAGFCENFNYMPLQYGSSTFAFYIFGNSPWRRPSHIYIRTSPKANIQEIIDYTKKCILDFSPQTNINKINFELFDEELQRNYVKESKLTTLIVLFTLISVIISLMGVFGLVMFETQHRHKEIGIRRVHGATIGEILSIFNSKFIRIVLICFVIASPISYYIINRWLETFAYRMPIHWWVFAIALALIMLITVTTVTIRSLHAATEDPVKAIKSE